MEKKPSGLQFRDYVIVALVFIAIISVLAYFDAIKYYDLTEVYYNGRRYHTTMEWYNRDLDESEIKDINENYVYTGITCKKMKIYDRPENGLTAVVIYLQDTSGKFHIYGLVGGP